MTQILQSYVGGHWQGAQAATALRSAVNGTTVAHTHAEELDFGEMFEDAEMNFGQAGEVVELNPQPVPPIGEVEPEFRIPEQFVPENDGMLKLGDRDFEFLAQDRAVSLPDFGVEPLQLDLASQPAFDASAFQSTMMIQ